MPDQPSPRDTAEAALPAECWDAVLSYADLCTAGSAAARELAREAFALGAREVRAAGAGASRGRRTPRLPAIPLMLAAVRTTAAAWEAAGHGHRLAPDLRLWLNSPRAARHTGPPLGRPLALRALRDLQEADAALLWLAEVEALPPAVVARRLGLDPAGVSAELEQVRALFRDRCHRGHLDAPMAAECRGYARLLDAVTRPGAATEAPEDLDRHLAVCPECAAAAACLRTHGGTLPAALAEGVIGWGGLAYLERRRRAADVRLGPHRPATGPAGENADAKERARARRVRGGLLATAVALSGVALTVSLMPFGSSAGDTADGDTDRRPVADPGTLPPSATAPAPAPAPRTTAPAGSRGPSASRTAAGPSGAPDPEPQGTSSAAADDGPPGAADGETAPCRVRYDLVDRWSDGFQVTVSVTTGRPLDTWRVAWSFPGDAHVTRMWDATVAQHGTRVTATATGYDGTVPADGTLSFGFVATGGAGTATPYDFTLDGRDCARTR
ncbi:cellulose-binding domain-containing protein [Streptomyces sp. NPDC047017]|uniref:cellulose-binding domain-containing protein n=1 Tax=Streptomyces sp. NPDC047017 TaxID=3155024 RepID=UPI0033C37EF4